MSDYRTNRRPVKMNLIQQIAAQVAAQRTADVLTGAGIAALRSPGLKFRSAILFGLLFASASASAGEGDPGDWSVQTDYPQPRAMLMWTRQTGYQLLDLAPCLGPNHRCGWWLTLRHNGQGSRVFLTTRHVAGQTCSHPTRRNWLASMRLCLARPTLASAL
jgi:hypothetical protein